MSKRVLRIRSFLVATLIAGAAILGTVATVFADGGGGTFPK